MVKPIDRKSWHIFEEIELEITRVKKNAKESLDAKSVASDLVDLDNIVKDLDGIETKCRVYRKAAEMELYIKGT